MSVDDGLTRDYRVAFLGYLPRREEAALHRGYQLGRSAVRDGLSVLQLAQTHHEVFLEVLRETPSEEMPEVTSAASEFFLEVLATFAMTRSALLDGPSPILDGGAPRPGSGVRAPRPRVRTAAGKEGGGLRPARS